MHPTPSEDLTAPPPGPILFYDGDCGICAGSVGFVLRHEHEPLLKFAPLQGPTAAAVLSQSRLPSDIGKNTIVLYENGQYLIRSRAVLRTLQHMGGGWKPIANLLKMVPTPLADLAYRSFARIRKHIPVGKACAILSPHQRHRFLP